MIRLTFALILLVRVSPALAVDAPAVVGTSSEIPSDAVVIFDGEGTEMLAGPDGGECRWPVENGELVCAVGQQQVQQGLWTRLHFRDAQIHVEFQVPRTGKSGEDAGNSGLYLHGLFELQILDSHENPTRPQSMVGAIYGISPPLVNAARAPGEWQTYDVIFKAPRRDAAGEPVEPGSITALLNGVLVQHEVPILRHVSQYAPLHFRTTPYADRIRESLLRTGAGPMQLQDHDNPVRFRRIWIRPLDDRSALFEPGDLRDPAGSE